MKLSRTILGRLVALCLCALLLPAAEQHGQVKFGGLPLPGATVTATQGDKTFTAITDLAGAYSFPDLAGGAWTLQVEMLGFETQKRDVAVSAGAPGVDWELKMLPLAEIHAVTAPPAAPPPAPAVAESAKPAEPSKGKSRNLKNAPPAPTNTPSAFQRADLNAANPNAQQSEAPASGTFAGQDPSELSQRASDGFLINGTANNGASSPFALAQAFGNNRRNARSLYSGNLGLIFDNSALDARPFSLTGQDTPRPDYNHMQGVFAFGGPLKIPHLIRNGGQFFVNYQWTRNRNASVLTGLVPTLDERSGDFSHTVDAFGKPVQIFDPATGAPIHGNAIPQSQLSKQAQALLRLYPLPNFSSGARYNYQIPVASNSHQDAMQSRYNRMLGRKNQISALFSMQSIRSDTPNLFGFLDTTDSLGLNLNANWRHNFSPRFFINIGYQFSRFAARQKAYFENRANISGLAGIAGNNQDPVNWGPPTLSFSNGTSSLTDGLPSFTRNQTSAVSIDNFWSHGRHNFQFGADFRRQQFNQLAQQNPRGNFGFTGAAAGYDLAGFLLGVPDTSSIAFGNADKYFRASNYDAFINDDWRLNPGFTLNLGLRWEYWAPITEKYGRLVNLDIAPGFTAETPVVAADPTGSTTGRRFPDSLIHPDKTAFQPRIAFSWRPFAASSMIVRGGYGVYYNTSVYTQLATQMAQQAPLSKSLSVQNGPATPLTLANGFIAAPGITPNTFAVDPNFQVGYSQNWQLSVQRDLPAALVMTATYLGSKGTRGVQAFLPNTYPDGAPNPCPACPTGFVYLTSNGNSTRHAGQLQLRRRLHNGFTAELQYTYSKSIDDAALGGRNQSSSVIAQNWLDLSAERALSNFDQRHLLTVQVQYTTGMGIRGGTLVNGWKGVLLKQWTVGSQITAGSGLPLSPVYPVAVHGTGVTGTVRPDYTGAPLYSPPPGFFLNRDAYTKPASGHWGNAGRNSITGPSQFNLNASLARTFSMNERFSLDLRVDATNALNHVTYPNWNTVVTSSQFGLPNTANAMRSLQTTLRLRF